MFKNLSKFIFPSIRFLWILAGVVMCFAVYLLRKIGLTNNYYGLAVITIAGFLFFYLTAKEKYKIASGNIIAGIFLFTTFVFIYNLLLVYKIIPEWDFLCFYLFGKAGVSGSDFYNPQAFSQVFNDLDLHSQVSDDFTNEIVKVGFWYPPPSMFLFLPLGTVDLKTGYIIWQSVNILFLIADIILLAGLFRRKEISGYNDVIKLFLLTTVILLLPDILLSTQFGQTTSLFLFFLLLLIKYSNNWKAGLFLAILIVIKPLAVFFGLYFLFARKWKILAVFFITSIVILASSIFYFGYDTFLSFFLSNPTNRIPDTVFYEPINQSLNGVLLRLKYNFFPSVNAGSIKIVYYFFAFIIISATIYSSSLFSRKNSIDSFMAYIPMSLLLYPGTLSHYNLLLLPVIFYILIAKIAGISGKALFIIVLILYTAGGQSLFLMTLMAWLILFFRAVKLDKHNNVQTKISHDQVYAV